MSRTLFLDDRLDDVVDVMMDVFVYNRPFIHDNALFVGAFLFFFPVRKYKEAGGEGTDTCILMLAK